MFLLMRHENTIVYQRCLALMETAREVIEQLPRGFSLLADQLRRNTSSPAHNFAEGYYQDSVKQQRRFFGYAMQSAREASASFDTAHAFRAANPDIVARGKREALEIVKMLSKFKAPREQASEPGVSPQGGGTQDGRFQVIR